METKLDALSDRIERHEENISHRLDKQERSVLALSEKMDQLLQGQRDGKADRALIKRRIDEIEPDAKTVREAKVILKWGSWFAAGIGATVTLAITFKGWILVNWHWLMNGK